MTWSRRAITLLSLPSAHANMIRARRATAGARSRSMCQRVQSVPFVFGHDQRNLGASRSHARLPVERTSGPRYLFQFLW